MSDLASGLAALNTIGLEDYEVSQGQTVGISTVSPAGTVTVGSVLAGGSGTLILIIALLLLFFLVK